MEALHAELHALRQRGRTSPRVEAEQDGGQDDEVISSRSHPEGSEAVLSIGFTDIVQHGQVHGPQNTHQLKIW